MDIAAPYESVVPTLDGPVLDVLVRTTMPLTRVEIWRLADRGSRSGVLKVLERLVATGLVHDVPGGYVLNRAHVAAPIVEALAALRATTLDRIREAIDEWDDVDVLLAGVYGSFARGEGDPDSDIDLLIVVSETSAEPARERALDLRDVVWNATGNEAQVVVRTPGAVSALRSAEASIVTAWDRELLPIVGDRHVLRAAA